MMTLIKLIAAVSALTIGCSVVTSIATHDDNRLVPGFRPPSVPLVVVDPYLRLLAIIICVETLTVLLPTLPTL